MTLWIALATLLTLPAAPRGAELTQTFAIVAESEPACERAVEAIEALAAQDARRRFSATACAALQIAPP